MVEAARLLADARTSSSSSSATAASGGRSRRRRGPRQRPLHRTLSSDDYPLALAAADVLLVNERATGGRHVAAEQAHVVSDGRSPGARRHMAERGHRHGTSPDQWRGPARRPGLSASPGGRRPRAAGGPRPRVPRWASPLGTMPAPASVAAARWPPSTRSLPGCSTHPVPSPSSGASTPAPSTERTACEARTHHRHHRAGRLLPGRTAAREGLRGARPDPPGLDLQHRPDRPPVPGPARPGRRGCSCTTAT